MTAFPELIGCPGLVQTQWRSQATCCGRFHLRQGLCLTSFLRPFGHASRSWDPVVFRRTSWERLNLAPGLRAPLPFPSASPAATDQGVHSAAGEKQGGPTHFPCVGHNQGNPPRVKVLGCRPGGSRDSATSPPSAAQRPFLDGRCQ